MSDKEKRIMDTFGQLIPKMSEMEQEKLLSFGEGMAFMKKKEVDAEGQGNKEKITSATV